MYSGEYVLSQLMAFLPMREFRSCVGRYHGDRRVRSFTCREHFLVMAFAQLTYRESLRDIETCLQAVRSKLYHAGLRTQVSRSTLADANEKRDWRIYRDFAQSLIARAKTLYASEKFGVDLAHTAYAFDSTTIDLCLSLFPWAQFRRRKGAVKLHTLIDLRGNIPCFVRITHGKTHDVKGLDDIPIEPGAFYVMDRGYTDYKRLHRFTTHSAYFVIRGKKNLDCRQRVKHEVDLSTGVRRDQTIVLCGPKSKLHYPEPLRRVRYFDEEQAKRFTFLTNNFNLPAPTIAQLYRCRWQVELFFRWIKQNLRIKSFYGTSPNAVRTQTWIAITVYVLVAVIRKELKLERTMGEILQILSVTLFEKMPLFQALSAKNVPNSEDARHNQLPLFDF